MPTSVLVAEIPEQFKRERKKAQEYQLSINAATDAMNMPFTEWEKVWGGNKTLFPQGYEGRESYKFFKETSPSFFQGRLDNLNKEVTGKIKKEELLTTESKSKAMSIRELADKTKEYNTMLEQIPQKFSGYTYGEQLSGTEFMKKTMTKDAREAIQQGKGIALRGDEGNDMTCIRGVCGIAARAGIDFKPGFAQYISQSQGGTRYVDIDERGEPIPQYNPYWTPENAAKVGYILQPKGTLPQEGDFMQYSEPRGALGQMVPFHMEMSLGKDEKTGRYPTFNNYNVYLQTALREKGRPAYNPKEGETLRDLKVDKQGNLVSESGANVSVFRLDPKVAEETAMKNPEYRKKVEGKKAFESSEDFKKFQNLVGYVNEAKSKDILGEDQPLLMDLVKGFGVKSADELKKQVLDKSKNPQLMSRIIDSLYEK